MRLRHTITEQRSIVPIKGMTWSRDFQVPQRGAWVGVRSATVRTNFRNAIIFSTPRGKDTRVTKPPGFYTKVKVNANRVTTWPNFYLEFLFF